MNKERKNILNRTFVVLGIILILPCAVIFQMSRINIWEGKNLRDLWSAQALDFVPIPAQRGKIIDDKGKILVTNTVDYNLAVDPLAPKMNRTKIDSICLTLARYTPHTPSYYLRKIHKAPHGSRYIVLARGLNTETYDALHDLNYRGIILDEQYKRRYNYDSLAANVLGFVNHNLNGMTGLEGYYNDQLKGEDGLQEVQRDRDNHIQAIVGAPRKKPIDGNTLQTTIDLQIQAIVEEELRNGIEKSRADYGTAIVMDPRTGAIKAMADYPTFDPNDPGKNVDENRRNYAISDMIEPGSTFKIVTAIAAIEQGVVHLTDTLKTPKSGKKLIHGQWMRDHEPLGNMVFPRVIQESSNIATADIAMRLKPDVFYQYARNLGFGSPTNIDLPDEEPGLLRKPYEWSLVTQPWMAVGYEVQITPIQLVQAYGAFANGGIMMRPYVVQRIFNADGEVVKVNKPVEVRRVAKPSTIRKLLPVFEGVVSDSGTAKLAQVKGMQIAGKTGTAQKNFHGVYHFSYRASFVGFFPANDPQYVCAVILDEPRSSIYGGQVSAPIFHNIAVRLIGLDPNLQKIIDKKAQPPHYAYVPDLKGMTRDQAKIILTRQGFTVDTQGEGKLVTDQRPAPGVKAEPGNEIKLVCDTLNRKPDSSYGTVPDVKGLSMRQAAHLITEAGYHIKFIGSGTVFAQYPKPKARLKLGFPITVRGKALPMHDLLDSNDK